MTDIFNDKSSHSEIDSDGIVFPIDIFSHQKTVETHIIRLVQEKVIANRELTAKEVIEQTISDINQLLKGISTLLPPSTPIIYLFYIRMKRKKRLNVLMREKKACIRGEMNLTTLKPRKKVTHLCVLTLNLFVREHLTPI
jgi:hypothetical protein